MIGGGGGGRNLEQTVTWAVAVVCFVLVSISFVIKHIIHLIEQMVLYSFMNLESKLNCCTFLLWLKEKHKRALYEALEKIKSELMLLGFMSLLLTVGQSPISNICISEKIEATWHPCKKKQEDKLNTNYDSQDGEENRRKLLMITNSGESLRRFLAGGGEGTDKCALKKKSKNNNKENEGENEIKQRITVTRTEIEKAIRGFPRVESVVHVEGNTNKQTEIREEHPSRFREAVENVQQASPLPKKDEKNDKKKKNGDGGGERKTKKDVIDKPKEKLEQKKSNELVQPQVATAMLKVHSHCNCEGCTKKIQKVVTKTIGYHQMAIDGANGQVTVQGSMDMNALAKSLELQLKKYVEIVPLSPQKEDEKKEKSGYDHKEKDGGERNIGGEGGLDGEKTEKSYDQDKNKKKKKKNENGGGREERKEKKKEAKDKPKEKPEVTKSNEVDLYCNCNRCTKKIQKVVSNTTGYHDMTIDDEKGLVTVTGSMDMKVLTESLRQQVNKDVQILATEANGGYEKEEENSDGERKAGDESGGYGGENLDQYLFGDPYRSPAHGYPTQIFSDENPNSCSVM